MVKSKEKRTDESEVSSLQWNKFNQDLACRVVKEFLKKHVPKRIKVVGPYAYIEGYPAELDLVLVTEDAIPAAFTNAYRDTDVRFVVEVKSHGYMNQGFPSKLLSEFDAIHARFKNVDCTYLAIRETWNPTGEAPTSSIRELKEVLEPKHRAFCLAELRTGELIPGQWRQFVNHILARS